MTNVEAQRVSFVDIEKHSPLGRDGVWYPEYLDDTHIVLFVGDVSIVGDLDLDDVPGSLGLSPEVTDKTLGVWITGSLHVSGSILKPNDGYGPSAWYLVVEGETKAKNIIPGDSEVLLWGGAKVANAVIAPHSKCVFNINGDLTAKWIISESDNFGFSREAKAEVVVQATYAMGAWGFAGEDFEDIFQPPYFTDVGDDEAELNMDIVVQAVLDDLNPFKDRLPERSKRDR